MSPGYRLAVAGFDAGDPQLGLGAFDQVGVIGQTGEVLSLYAFRRLGATLGKIVFHVHAAIPSSWNRPCMPLRRVS